MTRYERYKEQLSSLEAKRSKLLRNGNYVKANELHLDIQDIQSKIKEAEEYEMKPIRELMPKNVIDEMGIIPLMIECHLIADMLTEVSYMIVDICKDYGLQDISFSKEISEILKKSNTFASFLTKINPELCNMLVRNETLNASLHKKYQRYIDQRLKYKAT